MRQKSKLLWVLLIIVALSLLGGGCGGGSNDSNLDGGIEEPLDPPTDPEVPSTDPGNLSETLIPEGFTLKKDEYIKTTSVVFNEKVYSLEFYNIGDTLTLDEVAEVIKINNTLALRNLSSGKMVRPSDLTIGDILIIAPSSTLPDGLQTRISSIFINNNIATVYPGEVDINNIFDDLEFDFSIELDERWGDFELSEESAYQSNSIVKSTSINRLHPRSEKTSGDIIAGLIPKITRDANGNVFMTSDFVIGTLSIKNLKINKFSFSLNGQSDVHVQAEKIEATFKKGIINKKYFYATKPLTFRVYGFPVRLMCEFRVNLNADISETFGNSTIQWSPTLSFQSNNYWLGDCSWGAYTQAVVTNSTPEEATAMPDISASGSISPYIKLYVGSKEKAEKATRWYSRVFASAVGLGFPLPCEINLDTDIYPDFKIYLIPVSKLDLYAKGILSGEKTIFSKQWANILLYQWEGNEEPGFLDPFEGDWVAQTGSMYDFEVSTSYPLTTGHLSIINVSIDNAKITERFSGNSHFSDGSYWGTTWDLTFNNDEYTFDRITENKLHWVGDWYVRKNGVTRFVSADWTLELTDLNTLRMNEKNKITEANITYKRLN